MYGVVDYGMKDGTSKNGIEWSAHLVTDGQDEPKIKFYQVYIVRMGLRVEDNDVRPNEVGS